MRIASQVITAILAFASFAMAQSALENGQRFLKENASGKTPKATDIVVVNYRGTLINGKVLLVALCVSHPKL
jgi:hypothetical protein